MDVKVFLAGCAFPEQGSPASLFLQGYRYPLTLHEREI